eukprot:3765901-Ditylum_brightwellii.AAC.1
MACIISDGTFQLSGSYLERLVHRAIDKQSLNALSCFQAGQLFARLSGERHEILHLTMKLLKRACKLDASSSTFRAELGHQQRLLGSYDPAIIEYQHAIRLDETNIAAVYGMIHCQILKKDIENAAQQVEFLSLVQDSNH